MNRCNTGFFFSLPPIKSFFYPPNPAVGEVFSFLSYLSQADSFFGADCLFSFFPCFCAFSPPLLSRLGQEPFMIRTCLLGSFLQPSIRAQASLLPTKVQHLLSLLPICPLRMTRFRARVDGQLHRFATRGFIYEYWGRAPPPFSQNAYLPFLCDSAAKHRCCSTYTGHSVSPLLFVLDPMTPPYHPSTPNPISGNGAPDTASPPGNGTAVPCSRARRFFFPRAPFPPFYFVLHEVSLGHTTSSGIRPIESNPGSSPSR